MNGFLNLLKPSGLTSNDVLMRLKRRVKPDKIGHLGTLDPAACGVLPVAIGKATRLFDFFLTKVKRYRAYFTFGKETDTLDSLGVVTRVSEPEFTGAQLLSAVAELTGKQMQVPPRYSAISIGGVRAYRLARSGAEFSPMAKPVEIYAFTLIDNPKPNTYVFDVEVSGGTYIRSIVRDLAAKLNTVGYMSALIRLQAGAFRIEDALLPEEVTEIKPLLIPVEKVLEDVPEYAVPNEYYKQVSNGVKITDLPLPGGTFRVTCGGEFFGLGERDAEGRLNVTCYLK